MSNDSTPPAASSSNAPALESVSVLTDLPPHPLTYLPPARAAQYRADVAEQAQIRSSGADLDRDR